MININQQKMIVVPFSEDNNVSGFYHIESNTVYLSAQSCLLILGLKYSKNKGKLKYRWERLLGKYYAGWIASGKPPIEVEMLEDVAKVNVPSSKRYIPKFIQENIIEHMCNTVQFSVEKYKKLKAICMIIRNETIKGEITMKQNQFKSTDLFNTTSCVNLSDIKSVGTSVLTNQSESGATSCPTLDYSKLVYRNFNFITHEKDFPWVIHTVYYENEVYINTRDTAVLLGLFELRRDNNLKIRWNSVFHYYESYCNDNYQSYQSSGIDINVPRQTNANTSPVELNMPEFLNKKVVIAIGSRLHNRIAKDFVRDLLNVVIPFFDNYASTEDFANSINGYDYNHNMRKDMIHDQSDADGLANYKAELFSQCISRIAVMRDLKDSDVFYHMIHCLGVSNMELIDIVKDNNLATRAFAILVQDLNQASEERNKILGRTNAAAAKYNTENRPLKTVVEFAIHYKDQNK